MSSKLEYICSKCNYVGKAKWKKRGHKMINIIAWLSFPFGLPYTIWQMFNKVKICNKCGSEALILSDSAVGLRLQNSRNNQEFAEQMSVKKPVRMSVKNPVKPHTPKEDNRITFGKNTSTTKTIKTIQDPDEW